MDNLSHFRVDEIVEGINMLPHEAANLRRQILRGSRQRAAAALAYLEERGQQSPLLFHRAEF
jgi:hypothetical protein